MNATPNSSITGGGADGARSVSGGLPVLAGVRPLWHTEFYDGPLAGVAEFCGELFWFRLAGDLCGDRDLFELVPLTGEEAAAQRAARDLFVACVGGHCDYREDGSPLGPVRRDGDWDRFYDAYPPEDQPTFAHRAAVGVFRWPARGAHPWSSPPT